MLANSDYGFCKTLIRDFIRNPRYFDIVISAVLFRFGLLSFKVYNSILNVLIDVSDTQQLTVQFIVSCYETIHIL